MDTSVVARSWDLGFKSDVARDQLPDGAAYRMKDYIPQLGAALRGRGGWSYASPDLSGLGGTATAGQAALWFPDASNPHLLVVGDTGDIYKLDVFDGTGGEFITALGKTGITHPPVFHQQVAIIHSRVGTDSTPAEYYDSGSGVFATQTLPGSPPNAAIGASWGSYYIMANGYVSGTRYPNRVWFSEPDDVETWNTGTSFWTLPDEVVRIVPLQNLIVFFGYENTWILVGDTPPPGGNLEERLLFRGNGVMDGRTVAQYKEYIIWANSAGIWKTDGSVLTDLTFRAGIQRFWREIADSFNLTNFWTASAGVLYGHYIISVHDNNDNEVVGLAIDLEREIAFELTNIPARMFARRSSGPGTADASGQEELFFADLSTDRVGKMSSLWTPSSGMQDANGTNVLPQLETAFWTLNAQGEKRIRRAYVTYGLTDGGGSPSMTVSFVTSPEESAAYTAAPETLGPTTSTMIERPKRVYINRKALGIGLKIVQSGRSTDTRLSAIEIEGHGLGPERT